MSRDLARSIETTSKKRQRDADVHLPTSARKSRKLSDDAPTASEDRIQHDASPRPATKHTKKERKQNRSTRIHSLRKQLARGTLPGTVQQEKERELAALVHEQEKTASQKQAKKTLEKYHYVRFLERRKAEKRLKQLRKQAAKGESAELAKRIHEMDVNRNYAVYAPLGQKYVSIFVAGAEGDSSENENEQSQKSSGSSKPPMWYTIEAAMLQGKRQLQTLRDSKDTLHTGMEDVDGDTVNAQPRKASGKKTSEKAPVRSRTIQGSKSRMAGRADDVDSDSSSDDEIDGGFFER